MIRPIDIKLNAAHPELPLVEATTFTGAPSSVFIRGVPKSVGNWSITAVNVAVTYPDNSTTTRAAVESAEGVWVATIPGTATSGRTVAGFRILADGIDENGAAVTGYVLGFADFSVFSFLPVPAPGETFYLLRYFDAMPTTPKKGDVAVVGGVLKYYNGSAWEPFAALDDAVTRTSANGVKSSGIWSAIWGALSALPTGFTSLYDWCVDQLAGKASKSDVPQVVAPSTSASDSGKAADAKATGDALVAIMLKLAPEWASGSTYKQYNLVQRDGVLYYKKSSGESSSTDTPSGSSTDWQSFSSLSDLTQLFLPLTGGTMTGELTVSNSNSTRSISIDGEKLRFYVSTLQTFLNIYIPWKTGTLALLQDTLRFSSIVSYTAGDIVFLYDPSIGESGAVYRCIADHSGPWNAANWTKLFDIDTGAPASGDTKLITNGQVYAALQDKANASDLRYAISESIPLTVTSGAASTTLDDRTHNVRTVAAPGSGNTTTITATLPPIVAGKSRDMFLNLTVGSAASDAGDISLSIVEPSGATMQIDIGGVEDIGIGKNEILISENALPTTSGNVTTTHWLVTARHEDFS